MSLQRRPAGTVEVSTYLVVVLVGVEHDGGVGQNVDCVRVLEQLRVLGVVALPKALHDTIDLLRLPRQAEGLQVHAQGCVKAEGCRTCNRRLLQVM